jgi:hypothetical protein
VLTRRRPGCCAASAGAGPGEIGGAVPAWYERFRQLGYEFAKFPVIGITGVFITNADYDLLFFHLGVVPATSTTTATVVERHRPADPGRHGGVQLLPAAPRGTTSWPARSR